MLKLLVVVVDFTHSIVMAQRGEDVSNILFGLRALLRLHVLFSLEVLGKYDNRQCWPDIQRLRADRSLWSAVKFRIQATR